MQTINLAREVTSSITNVCKLQGWDAQTTRVLEDHLSVAFARKMSFGDIGRSVRGVALEDDMPLSASSLWRLPDRLAKNVVGLLALPGDITADKQTLVSNIEGLISSSISRLVEPSIFDFINERNEHRRTSVKEFLGAYPVLEARIAHLLTAFVTYIGNVMGDLEEDLPELQKIFHSPLGKLRSLRQLPSDPHDGQRRTLLLELEGGHSIVYKPRPLAGESYLSAVLKGLASHGISFVSPVMLDKSTHGWMQWIEQFPYGARPEDLAKQVGMLLAISTTISLVDLHSENVLLSKDGLVVIDAEAIGLISPRNFRRRPIFRRANVLDTHILPEATGSNRATWWDVSLCGITAGRRTLPDHLEYVEHEAGRMPVAVFDHIEEEYGAVANVISDLHWKRISDLIVEGFAQATTVLSKMVPILPPEPSRLEFRYVHRATAGYARTLLRMTDPLCAKSFDNLAIETAPYLKELHDQGKEGPMPLTTPIVAEEVASLICCDIPRLTARHLNECIPRDEALQVWLPQKTEHSQPLIELAFRARAEFVERPPDSMGAYTTMNPHIALEPAEQLQSVSEEIRGTISMLNDTFLPARLLGIAIDPSSGIPGIQEIGTSLYEGAAGIVLALGLARVLVWDKFETELISEIAAMACGEALECEHHINSISSGPFGLIYAASFLYKLSLSKSKSTGFWEELLDSLLASLNSGFFNPPDDTADVVSGLAGWILVLTSVPPHLISPQVTAKAEHCIKRLVELQQPTGAWPSLGKPGMCGFSHGAAGIRYALGRALVRNYGPSAAIQRAMRRAVEFEQREYDSASSNWRDHRYQDGDPRAYSAFSSWCHGAAGIALAEIGLRRIGLPIVEERILPAVTVSRELTQTSLCCGVGALMEVYRLSGIPMPTSDMKHALLYASGSIQERNSPTSLFGGAFGARLLHAFTLLAPESDSFLLFE